MPLPTVHDVAAYIIAKRGSMSAMKLEKLVFYSQAWTVAWRGQPLFSAKIQAWTNGPVCGELYEHHRKAYMVHTWPRGDASNVDSEAREDIDRVLHFYGERSAESLGELTHQEEPWKKARVGLRPEAPGYQEITVAAMRDYYGRLARLHQTPIDEPKYLLLTSLKMQLGTLEGDVRREVLRDAAYVAEQIVAHLDPTPVSVTVSPSEDQILFSLFGGNGREADVWVAGDNRITVVKSESDVENSETKRPIPEFREVASWLNVPAS